MAKEACEQEVTINGKQAKPGDEVEVGDIVELGLEQVMLK